VRTSWLTDLIVATGPKGGTVDADAFLQKEGYSRDDVKDLIAQSHDLGWY
jgi:hypothetical protein